MFAASKTDSASDGGYQISRSLRFNSADSAYLNRTPASATNQKTWTWSGWVKRSALRASLSDPATIFNAGGNGFLARFSYANQDQLEFYNFSSSAYQLEVITTAVFRDVSAWYHIVFALDTTQATNSNRFKVYVNGTQVTAFSTATYPSQNADLLVNNTSVHALGVLNGIGGYYSGYMTEINFIDGQALTPSSFGETNAQTGVWQPKAYSGSYGTNGFYLNFSDNSNTTAATLGKDYSGNGNNWTPNNFSVTAGAGNDSFVDSPTSYGVDTGVGGTVRGNYCTLNPISAIASVYNSAYPGINNGAMAFTPGVANWTTVNATMGVSSGKWYWEVSGTTANEQMHGVAKLPVATTANVTPYLALVPDSYSYYINGHKYSYPTVGSAYGASYTTNDVVGVALDMDAGTITFYKNGTSQGVAFTGLSGTFAPAFSANGNSSGITVNCNFGQRPFAYTAPSGFKALCTQNLPTPTIGATTATQAGQYFAPVLYTGTGSNLPVTVGFQPDMIWTKARSAVDNNVVVDAIRGIGNILITNGTGAEQAYGAFVSFNTDGFTKAAAESVNGRTYVAWNWKANGSGSTNTSGSITSTVSANTTSGFSVVTYTGTGTAATIGHGLGVAPSMLIFKSRSNGSENWNVYHKSLGASTNILLNSTIAAFTDAAFLNATAPTSTVLSVGGAGSTGTNQSSGTYVCYAFAEVAGYSKMGSYTGNGSTNFIYTGFRPAYVLIRRTNVAAGWGIIDSARNPINSANKYLNANASDAEGVGTAGSQYVDLLSNGFKCLDSSAGFNASGDNYIYMAFAESPFKYSLAR